MVNIRNLIDDVKCFQTVRDLRWPQGVTCPHCTSGRITKQGHDTTQPARQRYRCQACQKLFDDLTGTIFAGHHQPLRVWILCLYFMGLNLSNEQVACVGRVGLGGRPPRPPTDPGLHITRTRFLTYDFAALRNRLWTTRGLGKP